MKIKKKVAGAAISAAVLLTGIGAASAGEITGNGKLTPVNGYRAKSICSFSGQNDSPDPNDPFEGRVQSFGQIVKLVGPIGGIPGTDCRGYPSTGG